MKFTKMQGLGNDYLYVYGEVPHNIKSLCTALSDRHFGAGSDGMIYISPSESADFKMRIFNADGSEAKMCGNGIRCVGKYVYDKHYTDKTVLTVETLSGIKTLHLSVADGTVQSVQVEMGIAGVKGEKMLSLAEGAVSLTEIDMGNPHAVIFTDNMQHETIAARGAAIEHHPLYPDGINVEFVELKDAATLRMRVWERGSGITLACGTGACASVMAAIHQGFCRFGEDVKVQLDGGTLSIRIADDHRVTMTGPAAFVYEGESTLC